MGELKAGVIGVGLLGSRHADVYVESPGAELAALADPAVERAEVKAAGAGARV